MNLELDLACIQFAICMHNQDACDRFEKSRSASYESQGWKALEGGLNGERQTNWKGIRGIRRMPCSIRNMGHTTSTKILGGVQ